MGKLSDALEGLKFLCSLSNMETHADLIYHLEAKVMSRGTGRSAVAASAYLSCSKILNDYDGVLHDYTRKKGLVWQEVFLPEFAPSEWKERGVLWNAVEENEKTKDSRLAREFALERRRRK